jgi:predicted nucleic acid-binding protein
VRYLLDVNILISGIIQTHPQNAMASAWLEGKAIVLCPLVELGFIRISSNPRIIGLTMQDAREALQKFISDRKAERIPDDLPALASHPRTSDHVTDHYLADLATRHGLKLATLDARIRHPSAELVR